MFDALHTENRVTAIYCPNCPDHKDDDNSLSVQIIHKTENVQGDSQRAGECGLLKYKAPPDWLSERGFLMFFMTDWTGGTGD